MSLGYLKKKVKKPRNNPYHQTCRFYLEKSTVKANFNSIALIASFQGLKQATSELDLAVRQVLLGLCYILKFIKFQIRFFIFGLFKKFRRSVDAGSIFFFFFLLSAFNFIISFKHSVQFVTLITHIRTGRKLVGAE